MIRKGSASVLILASGCLLLGGCRTPDDESPALTSDVTLYFTDAEVARTFDCRAVLPARRVVSQQPAPADLIRMLFRGVTAEEEAAGLSSHFEPVPGLQPPGTRPLVDYFHGVVIDGGVAFLDFESGALAYLNTPACAQFLVKSPIRHTLLEIPGVLEVQYRIDGVVFEDWDA